MGRGTQCAAILDAPINVKQKLRFRYAQYAIMIRTIEYLCNRKLFTREREVSYGKQ